MNTTARCLQMMLRIEEYRQAFVASEGIQAIVTALTGKTNFQLQYQLIFALWWVLHYIFRKIWKISRCLTFSPSIASKAPSMGVIAALGDILSESSKEKVVRIILATFSNILNKVGGNFLKV